MAVTLNLPKDLTIQTMNHAHVVFSGGITVMNGARLRSSFGAERFEKAASKEIAQDLAKAMIKRKDGKAFPDDLPPDFGERQLSVSDAELEEFANQVLKNWPGVEKNHSQDGEPFSSASEKLGRLWCRNRLESDKRFAEIAATLNPRMTEMAEAAKKAFDQANQLNRMPPKATLDILKNMEKLGIAAL